MMDKHNPQWTAGSKDRSYLRYQHHTAGVQDRKWQGKRKQAGSMRAALDAWPWIKCWWDSLTANSEMHPGIKLLSMARVSIREIYATGFSPEHTWGKFNSIFSRDKIPLPRKYKNWFWDVYLNACQTKAELPYREKQWQGGKNKTSWDKLANKY